MFKNCISEEKVEYLEPLAKPRIIFPSQTLAIIHHIVQSVPQEVGWLGYVEEDGNDLTVTDIYIPGQHVHGATCELDEGDSLTNVCLQVESEGKDPSKIRYWGHSHGSGGVFPSQQDKEMSMSLMKDLGCYLVRSICNKAGDMSVSFFDMTKKRIIENIQWYIHDGIDREAIKAKFDPIIKENVKEFTYRNNAVNVGGRVGKWNYQTNSFEYEDGSPMESLNSKMHKSSNAHFNSKPKNLFTKPSFELAK